MTALRSPYPWFGGKSRAARLVWERFGDVPNYVEPFFGSGAMLLARSHWPFDGNRVETINDLDGFVPNFWRAIQAAPDEVARWADWPVSELDMQARHLWLTNEGRAQVQQLRDDPDHFDAKIAGWWVWGICQWIGSGWCEHPEWQQRPHLGNAGMGIHRPSQQRPHLGDAGRGIHRPSQQRPHLGDAGRGELVGYFRTLAARLERVRVCCGDWSRVCGPTPTVKQGLTAVFLDPPYSAEAGRDGELYAAEDLSVAHAVREWCIANGNDKRLRIALCGYEGEHDMPAGWECVWWKAKGGYGSQSNGDNVNAKRERIWFSPHCLNSDADLFAGVA